MTDAAESLGEFADPDAGFGRFTGRARNVVVEAQKRAAEAATPEIAPTHLLLAMSADSHALAVRLLAGQGVDFDAVTAPLHHLGVDRDRFQADLTAALKPFRNG